MQHRYDLGQKYRIIFGYVGLIEIIAGTAILFPLVALIAYPEETNLAWGLFIPGLLLVIIGSFLWGQLKGLSPSLRLQDGSIIVVLSWLIAILIGTIPLMTIEGLHFSQAVFESTSGWTTTGLSVLDVSQTSHLILLYRSTMQLVGGAGFAIMALGAMIAPTGMAIATAEGRSEQLVPHIQHSAKLVLQIYTGYVCMGVLAFKAVGMNWFEAFNHAFAALSTGGFSTCTASIGDWDNPLIELVTIFLMLLGTLNFLTSYLFLTGKFKAVSRNSEIKFLICMVPLCIVILLLGVTSHLILPFNKALRIAIFSTITALSTSGFSTVSYTNWNSLGFLVLIVLMLIGGGMGATSGGIKQFRICALYRGVVWEVRRQLLPKLAVTEPDIWQGETRYFLGDYQLRRISMFVFMYLGVYLTGSTILCVYGYSLSDSLFEYASALSTVGLSVGVTDPNAPVGVLWTEIIGMFLGRLEIFPVLIGLIWIYRDICIALKP